VEQVKIKFKGSDLRKEYRVSGTEPSTNEHQKARRADVSHEKCASGTPLADKTHEWQPAVPTRNRQRMLFE
jgi:hypothetical protein